MAGEDEPDDPAFSKQDTLKSSRRHYSVRPTNCSASKTPLTAALKPRLLTLPTCRSTNNEGSAVCCALSVLGLLSFGRGWLLCRRPQKREWRFRHTPNTETAPALKPQIQAFTFEGTRR